MDNATTYVGLDAHKNVIAIAMLVPAGTAPVRWQEATTPEAIRRLIRWLRRVLCPQLDQTPSEAYTDAIRRVPWDRCPEIGRFIESSPRSST